VYTFASDDLSSRTREGTGEEKGGREEGRREGGRKEVSFDESEMTLRDEIVFLFFLAGKLTFP